MATQAVPQHLVDDLQSSLNSPATLRQAAIIVPTFNAEKYWQPLRAALDQQGLSPDQILIIDSSSTDGTAQMARDAGYRVATIASAEFDHGRTRQAAAEMLKNAEFLVYLTQDAVLADGLAIQSILTPFQDARVGAVGGRQLPRPQADPIEEHARLFNYAADSSVRTLDSRLELGIKAAFLSNSFAAYRRKALLAVGGFPAGIIVAEDLAVAAKLLLGGWKVSYQGEARVYHSHPLSIAGEFRRYFDTGVMHQRESWLLDSFGGPGGEGGRFVRSELRFLSRRAPAMIPKALLRTASKLLAYRLGRAQHRLPLWLKRRLTAQPNFWREPIPLVRQ